MWLRFISLFCPSRTTSVKHNLFDYQLDGPHSQKLFDRVADAQRKPAAIKFAGELFARRFLYIPVYKLFVRAAARTRLKRTYVRT